MPTPANFPLTWENPDDERMFWTLERLHSPDPMTLMDFTFNWGNIWNGFNTTSQYYEFPIHVYARRINTYQYASPTPIMASLEEMEVQERRAEMKLTAVMSRLSDVWNSEFLPEIKRYIADWESFDLRGATMPQLLSHLDQAALRYKRLWEIHFQIWFPTWMAFSMFDDLCSDLFGNENALDIYRLIQGFNNKTFETDHALWRLSRKALVSPKVLKVLEESAVVDVLAELEKSSEGMAFLAELRAYLNEYGQRSDKFTMNNPNWIEDLAPVIKNLKDNIASPDRDPMAEMAALAAERERMVAQARQRLKGYPQTMVDRFEFFLKAAQEASVLIEDHFFWIDSRGIYQMRRIMLEFGRRFAESTVLDKADDIFHLTIDELRKTASALPNVDRRQIVAQRKEELEKFRSVSPPLALGTTPTSPPPDTLIWRLMAKYFGSPPQPLTESNVMRGTAASPGMVRGQAKVIRSLSEARKLQKGDILVAEMTTPPWTPLFVTAAAVVTDTGGVLCHCAICAREYHIPAVVGTGTATSLIKDGQLLEVDGNAGVVRILSTGQ